MIVIWEAESYLMLNNFYTFLIAMLDLLIGEFRCTINYTLPDRINDKFSTQFCTILYSSAILGYESIHSDEISKLISEQPHRLNHELTHDAIWCHSTLGLPCLIGSLFLVVMYVIIFQTPKYALKSDQESYKHLYIIVHQINYGRQITEEIITINFLSSLIAWIFCMSFLESPKPIFLRIIWNKIENEWNVHYFMIS